MQWFKSAMVVSSVAIFAGAFAVEGCSSNPDKGGDGGDTGVTSKDGNTNKDVNQGGDSGSCASGLTCEVCDVSGYSSPTMGTPIQAVAACKTADLQAFETACFSSTATSATCATWQKGQPDGGACSACLGASLQSDTSWGPFDCESQSSPCGANSGGCVDLVLKTQSQEKVKNGAGSCGDLITANFGCQDYACGGCSDTDFTTCDTSATANECKSYVDAFSASTGPCAPLLTDATVPADSCFPQADDASRVAFLDVFCGTGTGTPN